MISLHTANRYEDLRAALLDSLRAARPADPFAPRQLVIPSLAVRRDVQLAMARDQGVCLRVEFDFLAQWLWRCLSVLVEVPAVSPFAPQRLTWRVFHCLEAPEWASYYPRLAHYLGVADPVMQYELATRVASVFEQLVTYRPHWLEAWQAGRKAPVSAGVLSEDEAWLAALWRQIMAAPDMAPEHPVSAFLTALDQWATDPQRPALDWPARVDIFALNTLPPQSLHLLQRLADQIDIHLYLLNPCAEYWFDVVSAKHLARLQASGRADFHETGNALLAAWGQQTQALLSLVYAQPAVDEVEARQTEAPPTLLGQVQNAILHLQPVPDRPALTGTDRSLEVHVCHSLTRELEVLHDRLMALTLACPDLRADQIWVALPDLEAAAPLIDAVFGGRGGLSYHITGRSEAGQNRVAASLLAIMDAAQVPLTASRGLALLRDPLLARRFGLDENAVEALADALQRAGLHWGLGKQDEMQGAEGRHGWEAALGRLFLGYVREPAGGGEMGIFQGELPVYSGLEGRWFGPFSRWLESISLWRERLRQTQTADEWLQTWLGVLDHLLALDATQLEDARLVRTLLQGLAEEMAAGQGSPALRTKRLVPAVARAALQTALRAAPRGGIPGGGVTFAALSSLRGLPYRVIALLGLNDGSFPQSQKPWEFDVLAQDFQPGDRQRRLDERNLFLDLLLSAREVLHLSYCGRSQRDDSPMPASVLVAELLEYLQPCLGSEGVARLRVEHPLQAFSPRYQDPKRDPRCVQFSTSVGRSTADAQTLAAPFFAQALAAPDAVWQHPALVDIKAFFRHPARVLLRERLGLQLHRADSEWPDEEPLHLAAQDRWPLADQLLPHLLRHPEQDAGRLAGAIVGVPSGAVGAAQIRPLVSELTGFAEAVRQAEEAAGPLVSGPEGQGWQMELAAGQVPVTVNLYLPSVRAGGVLRYRFAPIQAGDLVAAWLDHLALCALQPKGVACVTRVLGRQVNGALATCYFRPVEAPLVLWQGWLEAYWRGLQRPLILPPRTAWAWQLALAEAAAKGLESVDLRNARLAWHNPQLGTGEALDVWWEQALRGQGDVFSGPLAKELDLWRERLLAPMLAHYVESDDDA